MPLVVPPPFTSRHLPSAWSVPSEPSDHDCACVPLQEFRSTGVKSADWPPETSRHLPAIPDAAGPVGPFG